MASVAQRLQQAHFKALMTHLRCLVAVSAYSARHGEGGGEEVQQVDSYSSVLSPVELVHKFLRESPHKPVGMTEAIEAWQS